MKDTPHLIGEMIAILMSQAMFIWACTMTWKIRTALPLGRSLFALTVLIALWVGVSRGTVVQHNQALLILEQLSHVGLV